jgi:Trk K+ transport system NAD-binding subunit
MSTPHTVILGGDTLAFAVCKALVERGDAVVVVWDAIGDVPAHTARLGARFSARHADERRTLLEAGIADAHVALALTEDDHTNLQFALTARDLNPAIRIVMRQFNRTLGRKIEQNLPNCSAISLSAQSAATYSGAALDRDCFYGVQFPDIDGPLVGFMHRTAANAGVVGSNAPDAEERLRARILACDGDRGFDRERPFEAADTLTLFAKVEPRERTVVTSASSRYAAFVRALRNLRRSLVRPDPIVRGAILVGLAVFAFATAFFAVVMHLNPVTAAYFVLSTMTTTGYGDITPGLEDLRGQFVSMLLMLAGLTFSGIFIAVLSSRFAQAQYIATQGLRPVTRRGHIVVCGAGHVGSRVVDQLVALGRSVVVIETEPKPETIARSRAGDYQLLTGDATKDATLDLCNITEAAALLALTNSDTMNLEIALGVRARSEDCHIVMRVHHGTFEASVRRHFGFERVFGTAALAAPVFVGLTRGPGMRGLVNVGGADCAVIESEGRPVPPPGALGIELVPLAVWRDGAVVPIANFDDLRHGERVLTLVELPDVLPA